MNGDEERIAALAEEVRGHMERRTRPDDTRYWSLDEERPEWMQSLSYAAHGQGDMLPDDWRYEFIVGALDAIVETEGNYDAGRDYVVEDVDIYTGDLSRWLSSHSYRPIYVNEAREEFGPAETIDQDMMAGQAREREEVYEQIYQFLRERAEGQP